MGNSMSKRKGFRGFTLVEVVVAVALVSFMGVSILGALAFGAYQKQSIRERNGAMRAAADIMETVKRTHFSQLQSRTYQDVILDDSSKRGNPINVTGTATLRFFTMDDEEVGITGSPIPLDLSMLRVEVEVTWRGVGRSSRDVQSEILVTLLAP
ncbi:MAG: prepilin-type N-terminal cleavage/methylation domain-containing protein [Candidatus Sumerlaeia bacterium]|nr:prepilin-type N-terminal cleavage/methylation domain-containing protein [Candidatus Sumerlaeia bacterium]